MPRAIRLSTTKTSPARRFVQTQYFQDFPPEEKKQVLAKFEGLSLDEQEGVLVGLEPYQPSIVGAATNRLYNAFVPDLGLSQEDGELEKTLYGTPSIEDVKTAAKQTADLGLGITGGVLGAAGGSALAGPGLGTAVGASAGNYGARKLSQVLGLSEAGQPLLGPFDAGDLAAIGLPLVQEVGGRLGQKIAQHSPVSRAKVAKAEQRVAFDEAEAARKAQYDAQVRQLTGKVTEADEAIFQRQLGRQKAIASHQDAVKQLDDLINTLSPEEGSQALYSQVTAALAGGGETLAIPRTQQAARDILEQIDQVVPSLRNSKLYRIARDLSGLGTHTVENTPQLINPVTKLPFEPTTTSQPISAEALYNQLVGPTGIGKVASGFRGKDDNAFRLAMTLRNAILEDFREGAGPTAALRDKAASAFMREGVQDDLRDLLTRYSPSRASLPGVEGSRELAGDSLLAAFDKAVQNDPFLARSLGAELPQFRRDLIARIREAQPIKSEPTETMLRNQSKAQSALEDVEAFIPGTFDESLTLPSFSRDAYSKAASVGGILGHLAGLGFSRGAIAAIGARGGYDLITRASFHPRGQAIIESFATRIEQDPRYIATLLSVLRQAGFDQPEGEQIRANR